MVNVLQLENASVALGTKTILHNVSLRIGASERVAILGANGAGKSTLLRAAHGIAPLASGTCAAVPSAQQAMVFQRAPLLRATVRAHLLFSLTTANTSLPHETVTDDALRACGLAGFEHRFTRSLSGGEQQRLALACAWARAPQLLFSDEATASLDVAAVQDVERLLNELNARGCALVFSTHSLAQAKRLAQRVIFLQDGRIADDVPVSDFFTGRCSEVARRFIEGERW